jgi:hypothetical protein
LKSYEKNIVVDATKIKKGELARLIRPMTKGKPQETTVKQPKKPTRERTKQ